MDNVTKYMQICIYSRVDKEFIDFENDLIELIMNITFRKVHSKFHDQLKKDIKSIK